MEGDGQDPAPQPRPGPTGPDLLEFHAVDGVQIGFQLGGVPDLAGGELLSLGRREKPGLYFRREPVPRERLAVPAPPVLVEFFLGGAAGFPGSAPVVQISLATSSPARCQYIAVMEASR